MGSNRHIWWLAPALFSLVAVLATGSLMRETDQASLVEGAWRIGQGGGIWETGFYNYDKQYLSYILPALFFGDFTPPLNEEGIDRLVTRLNRIAAGLFLAGLWIFVGAHAGGNKRNPPPEGVFLIAFLTTPAVFLSVPVASSAIVSAGFLLALAAAMNCPGGKGNTLACTALCGLAVGARADALLCLPLFCWASARPGCWKGLFAAPRPWWMAAGAALALLAGRLLAGESGTTFYRTLFDPLVAGAYLVFGLGGTILAAVGIAVLSGAPAARKAGFRLAGVGFLALPLLFYGPQLFSPRHLIPAAVAILVAVTGFRGRALVRLAKRRFPRRVWLWKSAVVAASMAPMLAGIRLPLPDRPSLTVGQPTLYPTADGLWPMGGYAMFLKQMAGGSIDHNQEIWAAAKSDRMQWPEGAPVRILETPMRQYLLLAARLRGLAPERLAVGETADGPVLTDERSLRVARPGHVRPSGIGAYEAWLRQFREREPVWLSGATTGSGIVLLPQSGAEGEEVHMDRNRLAREISILLGGVDVVAIEAPVNGEGFTIDASLAGKTLAFSSPAPFRLQGRAASRIGDGPGGHYVAILEGTATARLHLVNLEAEGAMGVWSSVLPDFMSRSRYRERVDIFADRRFAEKPPR